LIGLFLSCERGPLQTHTGLFVAFLAAAQQQLSIGLGQQRQKQQQHSAGGGGRSKRRGIIGEEGDGESSNEGDDEELGGACPLGVPFVEELLPDSFLRKQFGGFFEMLQDAGGQVPPVLGQQADRLQVLLRERLGWDYRVRQLGAGCGGVGGGDDGDGDGDEDEPVVVELTEEEMRLAGLDLV